MDMTEVKAFEAEDLTKIKASEWLRRGIPLIPEYRPGYYHSAFGACALGTAAYAKLQATNGRSLTPYDNTSSLAPILGIPYLLATRISLQHNTSGWSREECVKQLEAAGY